MNSLSDALSAIDRWWSGTPATVGQSQNDVDVVDGIVTALSKFPLRKICVRKCKIVVNEECERDFTQLKQALQDHLNKEEVLQVKEKVLSAIASALEEVQAERKTAQRHCEGLDLWCDEGRAVVLTHALQKQYIETQYPSEEQIIILKIFRSDEEGWIAAYKLQEKKGSMDMLTTCLTHLQKELARVDLSVADHNCVRQTLEATQRQFLELHRCFQEMREKIDKHRKELNLPSCLQPSTVAGYEAVHKALEEYIQQQERSGGREAELKELEEQVVHEKCWGPARQKQAKDWMEEEMKLKEEMRQLQGLQADLGTVQ